VLDLDQLRIILQNTTDVDATAQALVETALNKGARDNVTALVVRYEADR
jgi:serine/threonine protein phosphatase PrpC